MKLFKYILIISLITLAAGTVYFFKFRQPKVMGQSTTAVANLPQDKINKVEIVSGATYGQLMDSAGVTTSLAMELYDTALPKYDLKKIKVGHFLELVYPPAGSELKKLVYKMDSEDELMVEQVNGQWQAKVTPIAYETKVVVKGGEVKSSMYVAALENDIDERAIIALADAFQWSIDFALDPRVGDTFQFVYEERYLNGQYVMPGKVLAGKYMNAGQKYLTYYFEQSETNKGYFDENGHSAQKMFLKAPVSFRYISSGFTTGARYVEAFNVSTGHRAVDYAAQIGTPIRSVGDGTIIFARWNGPYGNMVKVKHNSTYTTNYGHMSKFGVKQGARVKQGDIIGYVGSTGFSTGPHLHYEMEKNGVKINPLAEVLPPGESIKAGDMERFFASIKDWKALLGE